MKAKCKLIYTRDKKPIQVPNRKVGQKINLRDIIIPQWKTPMGYHYTSEIRSREVIGFPVVKQI